MAPLLLPLLFGAASAAADGPCDLYGKGGEPPRPLPTRQTLPAG